MATEAAIFPDGDPVFARLSTLKRDRFPCFTQLSSSDIGYRLRDVTRLRETRKKSLPRQSPIPACFSIRLFFVVGLAAHLDRQPPHPRRQRFPQISPASINRGRTASARRLAVEKIITAVGVE
jgi:hypothetical protein